jgi:hypothetical protein
MVEFSGLDKPGIFISQIQEKNITRIPFGILHAGRKFCLANILFQETKNFPCGRFAFRIEKDTVDF